MITTFQQGNTAAEKWTKLKSIFVLTRILCVLWKDKSTGKQAFNPVRANDIRFRGEACLIVNISERQYQYLKAKFANKNSFHYDEEIADLINKIEGTCECRLAYSGKKMDVFILKKHYGYK